MPASASKQECQNSQLYGTVSFCILLLVCWEYLASKHFLESSKASITVSVSFEPERKAVFCARIPSTSRTQQVHTITHNVNRTIKPRIVFAVESFKKICRVNNSYGHRNESDNEISANWFDKFCYSSTTITSKLFLFIFVYLITRTYELEDCY